MQVHAVDCAASDHIQMPRLHQLFRRCAHMALFSIAHVLLIKRRCFLARIGWNLG
jgi:hypothetical protein